MIRYKYANMDFPVKYYSCNNAIKYRNECVIVYCSIINLLFINGRPANGQRTAGPVSHRFDNNYKTEPS